MIQNRNRNNHLEFRRLFYLLIQNRSLLSDLILIAISVYPCNSVVASLVSNSLCICLSRPRYWILTVVVVWKVCLLFSIIVDRAKLTPPNI